MVGSGHELLKHSAERRTWKSYSSTQRLSAHTNTQLGHQKNGRDQAIGRSRGGLTTKIHACVDALGNPLRLILTGGQVADVTQGAALIDKSA